jgi:predicted GH43/DUF377 family glycosyl hydrolase
MPVPVTRTEVCFRPDPRRVITKPFLPTGTFADGSSRADRILARILALPEPVVVETLAATWARFSSRHAELIAVLERSFREVAARVPEPNSLSTERRRLIGAYFTHEYSVDAAALSNPSMVAAPDQSGVGPDEQRFVMSLRAIGEGHVSSIQFRSGVVDRQGRVSVDAASSVVCTARRQAPLYDKAIFRAKLVELQSFTKTAEYVFELLPDQFTLQSLDAALRETSARLERDESVSQTTRTIHWLASSNYESTFDARSSISARVLFPAAPTESHGMEDARFVRFCDDDGRVTYFATYTAYDGYRILPQLIETRDFVSFRVATLNGKSATNKGIALFPRKLDGSFVALGRLDNENNHLLRSDNIHFWNEQETLQVPESAWELTQIGNCGSPLETEAGWLVITHGVGPFREYVLGAILLDAKDPARVLGRLAKPLLCANEDERDGYVPNVVYSCGSMIFGNHLVLPYGISDVAARIATVRLEDLLERLTSRATRST